jgi:hypothetical protein
MLRRSNDSVVSDASHFEAGCACRRRLEHGRQAPGERERVRESVWFLRERDRQTDRDRDREREREKESTAGKHHTIFYV